MRQVFTSMVFWGLILGQGVFCAHWADPNLVKSDPNTPAFMAQSDPNTTAMMSNEKPLAGTLGMNWLYQGKQPPQPLVGQENVTFRIERYPWPYTDCFQHDYFASPWCYNPWYRNDYWRYYSNDYWNRCKDYSGWWYNNAYTYPLNYVEIQMQLDSNTSLHFGASFLSDPLGDHFRP
jgi:hypothetical protein